MSMLKNKRYAKELSRIANEDLDLARKQGDLVIVDTKLGRVRISPTSGDNFKIERVNDWHNPEHLTELKSAEMVLYLSENVYIIDHWD